jgi:hypothetical protein
MERSCGEADLASWHEHDGEGEQAAGVAAGVLHDEILRRLVVLTQQCDAAA